MTGIIYLPKIPNGELNFDLVHEAAHARHFLLDHEISEEWVRRFSLRRPHKDFIRNGSSAYFLDQVLIQGALEWTAVRDYNIDVVPPALEDREKPKLYKISSGFSPLELVVGYDGTTSKDHENDYYNLMKQVQNLPGKLSDNVNEVHLIPQLRYLGMFSHGPTSPEYKICTEDIAVTTEKVIMLSRLNIVYSDDYEIMKIIARIPKARERIDLLLQHDFIDSTIYTGLKTMLKTHVNPNYLRAYQDRREDYLSWLERTPVFT